MSRNRSWREPAAYGGAPCFGVSSEQGPCNTAPCADQCTYSDWTAWPNCVAVCGTSVQMLVRNRSVTNKNTTSPFVVTYCQGNQQSDSKLCGLPPCEVACQWGLWSDWGSCVCPGGTTQGTKKAVRDVVTAAQGTTDSLCNGQLTQSNGCSCPALVQVTSQEDDTPRLLVLPSRSTETEAHMQEAEVQSETVTIASEEKDAAALPRQELLHEASPSLLEKALEAGAPSHPNNLNVYLDGNVKQVEAHDHVQKVPVGSPRSSPQVLSMAAPNTAGATGGNTQLKQKSTPTQAEAQDQSPNSQNNNNGATNIIAIIVITLAGLCIVAACIVMSLTVAGKQRNLNDGRANDMARAIERLKEQRQNQRRTQQQS